jgi:hypothetical protein
MEYVVLPFVVAQHLEVFVERVAVSKIFDTDALVSACMSSVL